MKQPATISKHVSKIVRGPSPVVPVEYETACKALEACCSIEEGKYWSDKADALAAWARIYHDDTVQRQAKILKLRAYRRMGEIARELSAAGHQARGARPLLREAGLSAAQASAAADIARVSHERMQELESRRIIPSINSARLRIYGNASPAANALHELSNFVAAIKSVTPREFRDHAEARANRGTNLSWIPLAEDAYEYLALLLA